LLPNGDLSAPEFPSKLGEAQLRPLHKFGQHLPPIALHSLSCKHFGVQFWTFVDEGQSAEKERVHEKALGKLKMGTYHPQQRQQPHRRQLTEKESPV